MRNDELVMKATWSCSRCQGVWRQRSAVKWYELWLRAVSARRPFCCTTCGRRAWAMAAEDPIAVIPFAPSVDEVPDVSLAAVDAMLSDLPPAGSVADLEPLVFDDDDIAERPRRPRSAARTRRPAGGADMSVH